MVSEFRFTVGGNFGIQDALKKRLNETNSLDWTKMPHSCLRDRNGAAELLVQNRTFKANWTMRGGTELFWTCPNVVSAMLLTGGLNCA